MMPIDIISKRLYDKINQAFLGHETREVDVNGEVCKEKTT
ncbi:hypothetical protein HNR44_002704 [Geomicrobium halophilum]|uniref:Uncharacterized protein n=1 Tax=Geomicrobium halophilum TaxID=549000 RepID=A0A841PSE2_9BACL|nr:hypothetical protein [Geomicrobium halophilum]